MDERNSNRLASDFATYDHRRIAALRIVLGLLVVVGFVGADRWFYENFCLWFNTPDTSDRDPYMVLKPLLTLVRLLAHASGIGLLYVILLLTKSDGFRRANAFLMTVLLVAGAVAVMQTTIARCRPNRADTHLAFHDFGELSLSIQGVCFPSGEAAVAFTVGILMAQAFPRMRWLLYGLSTMVAVARLLPGAHYPSDVLASVLIALFVARPLFARFLEFQEYLIEWNGGSQGFNDQSEPVLTNE